jgi:hypothetical protein
MAPSHFFLFGSIKNKLQETEFMEKDNLLARLRGIVNATSGNVLKVMFIEWQKRLQICIDAGGESIEPIIMIYTVTHIQ